MNTSTLKKLRRTGFNFKKIVLTAMLAVSMLNVSAFGGKYKKQYPLHYAVLTGDPIKVSLAFVDFKLAAADCNYTEIVNSQDDKGRTPLHIAFSLKRKRNNYSDVMEIINHLMKYNPNLNIQDDKGNTPLFYVMSGIYDNLDHFVLLLMNGARIDIKNKKQQTVWDVFFQDGETKKGLSRRSYLFPKITMLMYLDEPFNVCKYKFYFDHPTNKELKEFYNSYNPENKNEYLSDVLFELKNMYHQEIEDEDFIKQREGKLK